LHPLIGKISKDIELSIRPLGEEARVLLHEKFTDTICGAAVLRHWPRRDPERQQARQSSAIITAAEIGERTKMRTLNGLYLRDKYATPHSLIDDRSFILSALMHIRYHSAESITGPSQWLDNILPNISENLMVFDQRLNLPDRQLKIAESESAANRGKTTNADRHGAHRRLRAGFAGADRHDGHIRSLAAAERLSAGSPSRLGSM
jgi:hypothetical protein